MTDQMEEKRHYGTCKECKHYVPVDKDNMCVVCIRPPNLGNKQEEWRLSKLDK